MFCLWCLNRGRKVLQKSVIFTTSTQRQSLTPEPLNSHEAGGAVSSVQHYDTTLPRIAVLSLMSPQAYPPLIAHYKYILSSAVETQGNVMPISPPNSAILLGPMSWFLCLALLSLQTSASKCLLHPKPTCSDTFPGCIVRILSYQCL